MTEVVLWDVTHAQVSDIVAMLHRQQIEFEFEFRPAWVNWNQGHGTDRRSVHLRFHHARDATWFQLSQGAHHES